MKEYEGEDNINNLIEFELDFAPYQPDKQEDSLGGKTIVIQHQSDKVAGTKQMKGAVSKITHKKINSYLKGLSEHQIKSFQDDINIFLNVMLELINKSQ